MFFLLQGHEYAANETLLKAMFRLRKKVFFDQLQWDVSVDGDMEFDRYDDLKPAYLIWCDDTKSTLYGSLRLLPTTGPTLLNDVFRKTYPRDADLCHPTIWEGTRMCVDNEAIAEDMPDTSPQHAMSLMLLALAECAFEKGIKTLVSNYEPHMKRIYAKAGAPLHEIGKADGYGARPVCCGTFEVSFDVVETMRCKLGTRNLLRPAPRRILAETPSILHAALDRTRPSIPLGAM
jgi:acyl homoserine lactone synthase